MIDYGYRAIHEMTVKAKAVIDAYYGKAPEYSYFNGCSTGGRQGLMEAQRFPDDYDGIISGAPVEHVHAPAHGPALDRARDAERAGLRALARRSRDDQQSGRRAMRRARTASKTASSPTRAPATSSRARSRARSAQTDQCLTPGQVKALEHDLPGRDESAHRRRRSIRASSPAAKVRSPAIRAGA